MKKHNALWVILSLVLVVLIAANAGLGILFVSTVPDVDPSPNSQTTDGAGGTDAAPIGETQESFDAFCEQYFIDYVTSDVLTLDSSLHDPSALGLTLVDYDLGDDSVESREGTADYYDDLLSQLNDYNYSELLPDQQRTYDVLKAEFTANAAVRGMELYGESFTSDGFITMLPVYFLEFTMEDAEDVDLYITTLQDVPRYVDTALETEREKSKKGLFMTETNCQTVIDQCNDFMQDPENNVMMDLFAEKLDGVQGLSEDEKQTYIQKNHDVVINELMPCYQKIVDTLTELKGTTVRTGGVCQLPQGKEYFAYLMGIQGQKYTPEEAITILETAVNDHWNALVELYSQNQNVENEAYEDYPLDDPEQILAYLKEKMQADFPLAADVNYTVRQVPDLLSDYVSPAFYMIPAVDDYMNNSIYLNIGGGGSGNELFPTVAHEGYPGHMLQFTTFYSMNPAHVRTTVAPLAYVEGWSSYTENWSYAYTGWTEDGVAYRQHLDTLVLAYYARLDIGINYEDWTREEAYTYFSNLFNVTQEDMDEVFDHMTEDPAGYLSYALGLLEMLSLRDDAQEELGTEFDAMEFHTFLLETGPCALPLLEDYYDEWLTQQGVAAAA